ncbi:histidine kinase [Actinosynnema sp. NPDC050436]|uniref:sensor histidine kinase n=1 Tax=Actinosynnema sp. NPDC050436 TaxID=3155659 RepID=UPI0033C3DE86
MTDSGTGVPLAALALCAASAQATALAMGDSVPPWTVVVVGAAAVAAFLVGRRTRRAGPALAVLGVAALPVGLVAPEVWATALVLLVVAVALPWLVGYSARQQADLAAAATDRVHLRERTLIAHDMHDTLGHELSLLALRAGALELARDLPEHHRAAAAELRAAAGRATENLAGIVTVLRADDPPPLHPATADVEDLVTRAAEAGLPVTLDWTGPRPLPATTAHTAHRVVREALTNAAKHAPGAPVRITVTTGADGTVVTVANPVAPTTRRAPGAGSGLTALRERVRLAGGTIRFDRTGGTFELVAALPTGGPR